MVKFCLACYIKKLGSIELFSEYWPGVLASLKQKLHDTRNRSMSCLFIT